MTIAVLPEEGKIRDFQNNIKSVANRNNNVSFSLKCKKNSHRHDFIFTLHCVLELHIVNILNTKFMDSRAVHRVFH